MMKGNSFMRYILITLLMLIVSACGKAKASSSRAEVVPAPLSGYTCFVIYNSDGTAVGGNCVKD
jgi:hypothetical protein